MDMPRSQLATGATAVRSALPQESGVSRPQPMGYGLPCAKCHLYYPADLDHCPTCHSSERVSPIVSSMPAKPVQSQPEAVPDSTILEQEREDFLRQFKSQLIAAHAEVVNATAATCNLANHRSTEPQNAEVCKNCYDELQERLDVCEAALHIDLKEATQIIYDAVWADPSDPSKTYSNAATALLTELRKRAGISSLLGPFQTLSH